MPGPRDAELVLRVASALTATETKTTTLKGGIKQTNPLAVYVRCPTAPTGTSPTLKVTAKSTTADKKFEVTHTDNIDGSDTYPLTVVLPLPYTDAPDWSVVLTVGGTTPSFANVEVWLERADLAAQGKT